MTMPCRQSCAVAAAWPVILLAGGSWAAENAINPAYRALPRPVHYETPLWPKDGPPALIVPGRDAPWTLKAARTVQQAVQAWSGHTLAIADDRTVTSDETWLLTDAYRRTPLIVLGNGQDNRVVHALGTRYLAQSNRSWPGGDRYVLRTVFEPFVADVNYLLLEASTEAGLENAIAKFNALLKTLPVEAQAAATLPPRIRELGGGQDKWTAGYVGWKPPAEWQAHPNRSVAELAQSFRGVPVTAGWEAVRGAGFPGDICGHVLGGHLWNRPGEPPGAITLDPARQRAIAAIQLLGCRAVGGRTHGYYDHYGAIPSFNAIRAVMQTGVLNAEELNEFENCIVQDAAAPTDYVYQAAGNGADVVGTTWGDRHVLSCLFTTLLHLDYVQHHCRLDETTRREIARRYDNARRLTTRYVRSFRDNAEDSCLGECTLLQLYCLLHQGLLENVRNGMLKHSADMYILSTDNVPSANVPSWGCYVGLAGFTSGPGGMTTTWLGGSLVAAAACYYDDPQYRWFVRNRHLPQNSEAASAFGIHSPMDAVGAIAEPTRYYGVRSVPFDERLYAVADHPPPNNDGPVFASRLPPGPREKAVDRIAFRDGFLPDDPYLFLATSQSLRSDHPRQNNSIARLTDLGDVCLYTNTANNTLWARNVLSVSNGRGGDPARTGCTQDALANLGDWSMVSSREHGVGGANWTRTIAHWRGHYFAVLDRVEARQDDEFSLVCRWRTPHTAALHGGVWTATAASGNRLRIQNTEPLVQTSELWENDGSGPPCVLQQYKQVKLAKGQSDTVQNLLYASGARRADAFEARRLNANAMLVRGQTVAGRHLALLGVAGQLPVPGIETDAAIYVAHGNDLYLAGATVLKAKVTGTAKELFWSQQPVNLSLDCDSGEGTVEISGAQPVPVRLRGVASERRPGRETAALAAAHALPKLDALLETLWNHTPPVPPTPLAAPADSPSVFEALAASEPLQRPLRRVTNGTLTSIPAAHPQGSLRIWNNTDNLEITLTFPEPTALACLRLVGIVTRKSYYEPGYGEKYYHPDDFRFSLVLSDDGFQKDVRRIAAPKVLYEETPALSVGHFTMPRLPTFRVEIGGRAKQVKLLPRATTKERPDLTLTDVEVYGAERVDALHTRAFAADIDGDGVNELVVGTSEHEVAAYDCKGKVLWRKTYDGQILRMDTADLDEDGQTETIVYLTTEQLRKINGDGSERPIGDLNKAQIAAFQHAGVGAMNAMAAWGPDGASQKEVLLWVENVFRVLPDGSVKFYRMGVPQGAGRLVNLYPGEPEVLATTSKYGLTLYSARRDAAGHYIPLVTKHMIGGDGGERGGFSWVKQVDHPRARGFCAAIETGLVWFPQASLPPGSKVVGWSYDTGGVPIVAALAEDLNGDGEPEVLLARLDGFINVFRLTDGRSLAVLNGRDRTTGIALLKGTDGKPCLAVGTRTGVKLFGSDYRLVGHAALPVTALAGPGGRNRDRVYAVDAAGNVTVLRLK
jgi:hypothetical protein